jgi:serine O-acetyltransferase
VRESDVRGGETSDRPRKASAPPVPVERGRKQLRAEVRAKHPRFLEALAADARIALACRSERYRFRGRFDAAVQIVRLMVVSDAVLAQVCYRAKARLQALGVPLVPRVLHRLAIMIAQVSIGDPVVIRPGVYIAHGQTIIDGYTEIHRGVIIAPWTSIGLVAGNYRGPIIGRGVQVGTGAKVLGPVVVHRGARIGANAVVVRDVPENTTVLGAPVRHVPPVDTH